MCLPIPPFAVPDKIFGLTYFLDFIDRGTHCACAFSATGSAQARGHSGEYQINDANADKGFKSFVPLVLIE